MARTILIWNAYLFLDGSFTTDPGYLLIENGKIVERGWGRPTLAPPNCQVIDGQGCYLAPGFWDIQTNGGGGIDLLSATPEGIRAFLRHCLRSGVTTVFPTVITASPEQMLETIRIISQIDDRPDQARIDGIHVEGPAISKGPGKGCHPIEHIRSLTREEYQYWQEISGNRIAVVTLAPEVDGVMKLIPRLVEDGVVVGIGHTDADKETIRKAIKAGATLATHLWNGTDRTLSRDLDHIGTLLLADQVFASFIVDGQHIHSDTLIISFRVKNIGLIILITDAMAGAGVPDGSYRLGELTLPVVDGIARNPNDPRYFAASTLVMIKAIENAVKLAEVSLPEAIRMATENPAVLMDRVDQTRLIPGAPADIVLFSEDQGSLRIEKVVKDGQLFDLSRLNETCPHCGSWEIEKDPCSIWYTDDLGPTVAPEKGEWLCRNCGAIFSPETRAVRIFGYVKDHRLMREVS